MAKATVQGVSSCLSWSSSTATPASSMSGLESSNANNGRVSLEFQSSIFMCSLDSRLEAALPTLLSLSLSLSWPQLQFQCQPQCHLQPQTQPQPQPHLVTLCVLRRSLSLTTRRGDTTFFVCFFLPLHLCVCSSCVQQNVPNCCALQTFQEFALNKLRKNVSDSRRESERARGGESAASVVFSLLISLFALRCTESYTRAATDFGNN